jgi:hypothetical protein
MAFLVPGMSLAQQQPQPTLPSPRIHTVMPPGGKAGTTMEVTVTGADIEDAQGLLFSRPDIKAEPLPTPPDAKKPAPAPKGLVAGRFKVTIPADTPPGNHDVRLVNKWGVSNPRAFVVGDLTEVLEKEPNNDVPEAQRVELNTTINGTIASPTDVDYYVFSGKKGQRVVVSCLASSIDSKLPAALQLFSSGGAPLSLNHDYQGGDAVLDCTLPGDGDYYVRVFSFTYLQGSDEHFYRVSITTAPWIDAVFPPVVEPGKPATLTVYGRNLPGGQLDPNAVLDGRPLEKATVTVHVPREPAELQRLAWHGFVPPKSSALDGFEYRIRNDSGTSNAFLLTYAQAPVILDNDANNTPETAQEVTLPCEIAGRVEKRHDRDWYAFTAKKGEVYSIEAFGDRLGSPIDLYFSLHSAADKKTLFESDDKAEILHPLQFLSRSDDPLRFRLVAPADGRYLLLAASREADVLASPRHFYRLRITPEQPDFRVIVMPPSLITPEACTVHQGGRQYYTVYVWRLDGFSGGLALSAEGLPDGVTCPPQTIGHDLKQGTLVVRAAPDAQPWAGAFRVKASAVINGRTVEREARAASVTWPVPPQNVPTVSRLDQSLVLAVREPAMYSLSAGIEKVAVAQGEKIAVPIKVERRAVDFKAPVQISILNLPGSPPPQGNNPPQPVVTMNPGKDDGTVTLDIKANVPPGTYTVVLRGQATVPFSKDPMKQKQNVAVVEPSAPIVITVVPKQVATLTVSPANPTVKAGGTTEVTVKATRQFDYGGELRVELVVPQGMKGLQAEAVTIPAGKDEAKLVVKVDEDAAPGNRTDLRIKATALVADKVALTHETKFSLNVVK